MSNSAQPHRRQPTRLPHPWDSPGKNTGVGCHFLLQCMQVKSESEVSQSCPTLSNPMDCSLPGSSIHGIFQARVLEWGAIAFSEPGAGGTLFLSATPSCTPVFKEGSPPSFNASPLWHQAQPSKTVSVIWVTSSWLAYPVGTKAPFRLLCPAECVSSGTKPVPNVEEAQSVFTK